MKKWVFLVLAIILTAISAYIAHLLNSSLGYAGDIKYSFLGMVVGGGGILCAIETQKSGLNKKIAIPLVIAACIPTAFCAMFFAACVSMYALCFGVLI